MSIFDVTVSNNAAKKTMNAVRMHSYGGPEVLWCEEVERPAVRVGKVLVRVFAAGVNSLDWQVREGFLGEKINCRLPFTMGWDFSGVVEAVGEGVTAYQKGNEVYGRADMENGGAYAEYIEVSEREIALKPKSIEHVQAAALPFSALTAWQTLFDAARLQAGQKVLIHAAARGVGHIAVQLAKWKGAYVIGGASVHNQDFLREIGADNVFDYELRPFEETVGNDIDVVLDTIGGQIQSRSMEVLKKGGILVSTVRPPSQEQAEAYGVRQAFVRVKTITAQLREIAEIVDSGALTPMVRSVFPLSEANAAQELNRWGHTRGKIVLKVV